MIIKMQRSQTIILAFDEHHLSLPWRKNPIISS